jgi:probable phosphoglycerate mutase
MTILLVRHGETEWNRARRHQGRFDSPLTARGLAQAHAIGRRLAGLPGVIAAPIVSSPQERALHTAKIICEELGGRRVPRLDARLREHSVGLWDGLTYNEIEALMPGIFDGESHHQWYFRGPGSEGYAVFAGRIGEWLDEQDEALPVIVVAHGLVSRVLRGLYACLLPAEALSLPVPQDRIFRLSEGQIETIKVESHPGVFAGRG